MGHILQNRKQTQRGHGGLMASWNETLIPAPGPFQVPPSCAVWCSGKGGEHQAAPRYEGGPVLSPGPPGIPQDGGGPGAKQQDDTVERFPGDGP